MLLTLSLALAPQLLQSPAPLAPYGQPKVTGQSQSKTLHGPAALEDFETYVVAFGGAENIGSLTLDDTTITGTGQGPGLVLPGCTYIADASSLQWNGAGWFGQPSQNLLSNGTFGTLAVEYSVPVSTVKFTLHAFDGFPDNARCTAYDAVGFAVDSVSVSVPDSNPVPVSLSGGNIVRVDIMGANYSWSPLMDDHDFSAGTGLRMKIVGPCPGVVTVTVDGGIPGGLCKIAYAFGLGSYTIPGGPCAGTTLGLDASVVAYPPSFFFDIAGQTSFNAFIPASACGAAFVQAVDVSNCSTSNVIAL